MKVVRKRRESLYVWRNIHLRQSRVLIFLILFLLATALFAQNVYLWSSVGLVLIPVAYVLGLASLRERTVWRTGSAGESSVLAELEKLADDYRVLNGVVVPPNRGDTDHIVCGPNGLFVIETKNYAGIIHCEGDAWTREKIGRAGTPYQLEIGSPSNQVKRNAKVLKDFVLAHEAEIFRERTSPHLWIVGIIVFTRADTMLELKDPTVPVVGLDELADYIESFESEYELSDAEIKRISSLLLKHGA